MSPPREPSHDSEGGWISWTGAGAPPLALAGLAFVHFREKPPAPPEPVRFQIQSPKLALAMGNNFYMPLSPDGRKLAYTAAGADGMTRLWIRDMDTLESRMLAGTEGAVSPFWSPDSRYLAFGIGSTLKRVDASAASPPQTLCQAPGPVGSGSWNPDGIILFGGRGLGPLQRCSASGGTTTALTALNPGETFHTFPVFLPDGHHFIYLRAGSTRGIYVGSLDAKPAEQSTKQIMESQLGVAFAPSANPSGGRLLFLHDNTLMAQPFNTRRLQLEGEPVPIAERVAQAGSAGWFSVSANGALAYRTGGTVNLTQLIWYDRKGNVISRVGEPRAGYTSLDLSPDRTQLAHVQQQDVWVMDLARGIDTRLTFHPALTRYPVWSADGTRVAFGSRRETGGEQLYVKPSKGAIEEQVLLASPEFNETNPFFSEDMRWIGYISNESGRTEAYVRPFLASGPSGRPALGDGKWQISKDGAQSLFWRDDGKEIVLLGLDGALSSVEISTSPTFQAGSPQPMFRFPAATASMAATRDLKRFLLAVPPGEPEKPEPITVVLNWEAALKK